MKKAFSILLALALILSLSSFVMAANITIKDGAAGSEYAAYRILNATDGGEGKFAYTLNDKYADILYAVTGKSDLADIIEYISALDSDGVRAFSDATYKAIIEADPALDADYTSVDGTFANVEQGYYLIAESKVGDMTDTFSLVMLTTAGKENVTIKSKEDKPTVQKQVMEKNDSTDFEVWGDSADYDFNDTIPYTITGRISNKYDNYRSYYYSINDSMEDGLTFNRDAKIYVANGDEMYEVTEYFKLTVTTSENTGYANGFTAECNLKELDEECDEFVITSDSLILVEYSVTLNEHAIAGPEGNKNTVYLEYENDPYNEGDGDINTPDKPGEGEDDDDDDKPGQTEGDTNIVFTYDLVLNKVDKDGNALEGAGFTLFKWINNDGQEYWERVGEEITGVTTFYYESIDNGKYKLVETKVPEGYNRCEDLIFEVVGDYDTTKDPVELTRLYVVNEDGEDISTEENTLFIANLEMGTVTTNIVNHTGAELPETGGMGTTMIYIAGAVLLVGAIVLLVAKKRMNSAE